MDIVYLRHGQTDWNILNKFQGQTDIPLNEEGRRQARAAAPLLKPMTFDAVFTSPLSRAVETEQIAYGSPHPIRDPRLMEWNFGVLEGKNGDDIFPRLLHRNAEVIPGAERLEDLVERVRSFYEETERRYPDGRILIVSHGGVSIALQIVLFGYRDGPGEDYADYTLDNSVPTLFSGRKKPVRL